MTKRLDITARQVTAICEGAKKAGCIPEIKIGNAYIRLIPQELLNEVSDENPYEDKSAGYIDYTLPDLSHSPKQKRSDDIPRELQRYYREIGFDPRTMGERERGELQKKAEQEWVTSVPGRPIGKRETDALEDLSKHGVGVFVDWSGVRGCGPDTMDRLVARGFITTKNMQKYPDRIAGLILTKAGMAAWKKIERER
ncbi:hypothetical protein [Brucella anthropi]|uniref:hypothetical protein n=1 Tax=Brucella anthropi TaxID=529 RepID=UPI0007751FD1|nr:hypothetical protein [Brucella anthropi]KXO74913.1 hypothetical protein AYJ56_10600 [Brucella anthropi]